MLACGTKVQPLTILRRERGRRGVWPWEPWKLWEKENTEKEIDIHIRRGEKDEKEGKHREGEGGRG